MAFAEISLDEQTTLLYSPECFLVVEKKTSIKQHQWGVLQSMLNVKV